MFGKKDSLINILAVFGALVFFACGVLVSLHRYWQFEVWYYDFGIFNQAIWNVSRFKAPIIDHFIVPGKIIFADHFNPSIFILSPLYWITDRAEVLLIAQSLFVAISGLILYKIGIIILEDKMNSLFVMLSYFLFVGLQNGVITEFHELTLMTPFLCLLYYFYVTKRKRLFIITFLILLGFKESLFTLGLGLGLFVFFSRKEWKRISLFLILFSLFWGIVTTQVIIPYFSHQPYYYSSHLSIHTLLAESNVKLKTLFFSFGSFIFLPFGALWLCPIYISHFLARFFSEGSTRWGLGLHYSSEIAPTLVFGTLLTLRQIKMRFSKRYMSSMTLLLFLCSFFVFRFILHGPFLLAINPVFYKHTKDFNYLEELIKKIPPHSSIAAQNNLAVRFYKQESYILRDAYEQHKPDYIFMDMRPGQNPNNFLGIKDEIELLRRIKADFRYNIFIQEGDQYLFKRIL